MFRLSCTLLQVGLLSLLCLMGRAGGEALKLGETRFEVQAFVNSLSYVAISNNLVLTIDPNNDNVNNYLFSTEAIFATFANLPIGYFVIVQGLPGSVSGPHFQMREITGDREDRLLFTLQSSLNANGDLPVSGEWIEFFNGDRIIDAGPGEFTQERRIRARLLPNQIDKVSQGKYLASLIAELYAKD